MIEGNLCFPNNVVDVMAGRFKARFDELDPSGDTVVIKRPIETSDPDQTLAFVPVSWSPKEMPEMGRKPNQYENTIQSYTIMIQCLVNDAEESRAIPRHSLLSTLVRRMLYRDTILLGTLNQLKVQTDGVTEATSQFGVRSQQFLVNKQKASFQYLSIIEFWLETQIN